MPKEDTWSYDFEPKNNLLYYLPGNDPDHRLKVQGQWRIDKKGSLKLAVDHAQNQRFGKTITVGAQLIRAGAGSLEFKAADRVTMRGQSVKTVTVGGRLTALPGKKLAFRLEREGNTDAIVFDGSGEVLPDNQIGCSIKRVIDKKTITDQMVLKGQWQVAGNTLSYKIEDSTKPFFASEFKIERAIFAKKDSGISTR